MNSHFHQSRAVWKLFLGAALFPLATALAFAGSSVSNELPPQITTTDGRTYRAIKLFKVLPDGLLVQYLPDSGSVGLARLKFTKLPESIRQQFGYDPRKASDYEKAEKIAMTELSRRMREDEDMGTATLKGTGPSSVTVVASQPDVRYEYYDPAASKPAAISEGMSGDTEYNFSCNPIFNFRVTQRSAGEPFDFHIETATMRLGVTIKINLPKGEIGKLKEHEDGHKQIVEYFYSLAPAAASQAAGLVTDLEQTSSAKEYAAAKTEVFTKVTGEVQAEYQKYIRDLCRQANDYYDELTDHGQNPTDSNQAAKEAIRRYAPNLLN